MRKKIRNLPAPLRRARLTQRDFLAWLYRQPAGRTFDSNSTVDCPLAQYLRESGYPKAMVWYDGVSLTGWWDAEIDISRSWAERFQHLIARRKRVNTISCLVDLFRSTRRNALSRY